MARIIRLVLLTGLLTSPLRAGTVGFDPPVVGVDPGRSVSFVVSIETADFVVFDTVSLSFTPYPLLGMSFEYAESFADFAAPPPIGGNCKWSCFGLSVGGNNFTNWSAPLLVGTLTIDTSDLLPGEYEVLVSSSREDERLGFALSGLGSSFSPIEPLEGVGKIIVSPEPTTLLLVLVGALASTRRYTHSA